MSLFEIKNLTVTFQTDEGVLHAVDGISLNVDKGKTVCVVGESGCGKSVTAMSIMRLIQQPKGQISGDGMFFDGRNIVDMSDYELRALRGGKIAMIFQDPMTSLNPVFTCGYQIAEALMLHRGLSKAEAKSKAIELLELVQIPDPTKRFDEYPHQLSGGMRQRIMIAMALSCDPQLLIADEPTTALDVTVQAQILSLLHDLKSKRDMALLFITHDLGVVAQIADEIIVLYAGKVAERGTADDILNHPSHPYTIGLLRSIPKLEAPEERLYMIPGTLPDPLNHPAGCRFYERCERRTEECLKGQPGEVLCGGGEGHWAACIHI